MVAYIAQKSPFIQACYRYNLHIYMIPDVTILR